MTIMPGMIDLHVHPALTNLKAPTGYFSLLFTSNALKMLQAGFTTIRCLGVPDYVDLDAKRASEEGIIVQPRISTAGMGLCVTNGHLHRLNIGIEVNGTDEYRAAARGLIKRGVDWLKMSADAITSYSGATAEEMKAAADVFHGAGKRVAVHAGTVQGISNALEAGADTVEHGFLIAEDAERITSKMIKNGTYLVPTLYIHEKWDTKHDTRYKKEVLDKVRAVQAVHPKSFKAAIDAGVKIAMGSDEGGVPGSAIGEAAYEIELMVRHGMEPMDAIVAATGNAADALGTRDLGVIGKDMLADVLVIDGDPTKNIKVLSDKKRIKHIILDGNIVKD